jgi:glycosyltransferase involved in cell wall biosynthesis
MTPDRPIRVAFTEAHGMAAEASQFGPPGVQYSFGKAIRTQPRFLRSPIKGFMRTYAFEECDLIEAVLSPIITSRRWIYSCENMQAPTAFSFLGVPLPRPLRVRYVYSLLSRDNCKQIMFWSKAGRATLHTYGGLPEDDPLLAKVSVVYPAVRQVPDSLIGRDGEATTLLFSGDFFRKGGVNVLDAFDRARAAYPGLKLLLCCDERIDFNTPNTALRSEYLARAKKSPGVEFLGRIPRDELVNQVLPRTSVYLLPTYAETFGMSILEAMAFGIPVVATNIFAIPEMVVHGETGLLIDVSAFDCDTMFKGYVVRDLPADFRTTVTEQLYEHLCRLAASADERRRLGQAALQRARTMFSFETRNAQMLKIYHHALA